MTVEPLALTHYTIDALIGIAIGVGGIVVPLLLVALCAWVYCWWEDRYR